MQRRNLGRRLGAEDFLPRVGFDLRELEVRVVRVHRLPARNKKKNIMKVKWQGIELEAWKRKQGKRKEEGKRKEKAMEKGK